MKILVTGGLGYIGSHTCLQIIEQGYDVIILDNLSNSNIEVLNRIKKISQGILPIFYEGDIRDSRLLSMIFSEHSIDSVIHFAGLKSVGDSISKPIEYYDTNIVGTLILLEQMKKANVKNFIFSSSATVYGKPDQIPLTELSKVGGTTNPYGTSKYMAECILSDLSVAYPDWSIIVLRYFNPVGAHTSGLIGEDPHGIPNNLAPYIAQVAVGRYKEVLVYGDDYATIDGTGVRDYIHVMDLASGHIAALKKISYKRGLHIYNLGTGKGTSVLEMIKAFEYASSKCINYRIVERRQGDIAECWSSPEKAAHELGWRAIYSVVDMVNDAWRWQSKNPEGYND